MTNLGTLVTKGIRRVFQGLDVKVGPWRLWWLTIVLLSERHWLSICPSYIDVVHLKRSRKFFDKTFKIAWNILRTKGDVYHVNYLLQDCYISSKLGKRPLVGHTHGSDLRQLLNHCAWKRSVKQNLKKCDVILVSTPEILDVAKRYQEETELPSEPSRH